MTEPPFRGAAPSFVFSRGLFYKYAPQEKRCHILLLIHTGVGYVVEIPGAVDTLIIFRVADIVERQGFAIIRVIEADICFTGAVI